MKKRVFVLMIVVTMLSQLFVGCSKKNETLKLDNQEVATDQEKKVFEFFAPLHNNYSSRGIQSHDDVASWAAYEEMTGIDVKWIEPIKSEAGVVLNLALASGKLPDAIQWEIDGESRANLTACKAVIPLNDLVKEHSPSYWEALQNVDMLWKQSVDNDGVLWCMSQYTRNVNVDGGFYYRYNIREDWLNNVGMEVPNTAEEMYAVLKAFKEKDANGNGDPNDEIPMTGSGIGAYNGWWTGGILFNPFGIGDRFYQKNGEIKFGPLEPEYPEALAYGRKLMEEGLLDPDSFSQKAENVRKKILSNRVGFSWSDPADNMHKNVEEMRKIDEDYSMPVMNFLQAKDGKRYATCPMFNRVNRGPGWYITSKCKDPEEVVKFLDYGSTAEGSLLFNMGIEGVSYKIEDGIVDYITLDPAVIYGNVTEWMVSLSKVEGLKQLGLKLKNPPHVPNWGGIEGYEKNYAVRQATDISLILPPNLDFSKEDSDRISAIMADVDIYCNEVYSQALFGERSIEEFDDVVKQLKKMGIDEVLNIYQKSLDEYNKR